MKILQLGKFYPIRGGVEKVMWDLTRGLSERGTDCDMLCAELGIREPHIIQMNAHGRVICLPAKTKKAGTMIAPKMIGWLRRHKDEYDIIHIHHPDPMACLTLRLSGYRGRVIVHWHSDIVSQRFFLTFYRPLQRWMLRRSDTVVGTSPVYLRESPDLRKFQDKTLAVPIGIDPVLPDAGKVASFRARYPGKKIILSLGRMIPYKGYAFLVGAMAYLPDDYVLVLAGEGPQRPALEKLAKEQGNEKRIIFTGYVEDDDVPTLFGACDVFVLSSVMKTEAFGIVQLEAFSCGRPVVATKIPESGVSWVNEDGVSGINVPVSDAQAIAGAVQKICGSGWQRYSDGARARFERWFRYETMIEKIEELYEKRSVSL